MTAAIGPTPYGANNATIPACDGFAVTPHDTTNFNSIARALYIGATGNVVLITPAGTTLTFVAVPAGFILPVAKIKEHWSTSMKCSQ